MARPRFRPKVLVVLDRVFGAEPLIRRLECQDVDVAVTVAPTLLAARIADERPDLVLIEFSGSDLNALLVLNQTRLDSRLQHIPVIVAIDQTSCPPIDSAQLRAERCAFLCRPYKPEDLLDLIDELLEPTVSSIPTDAPSQARADRPLESPRRQRRQPGVPDSWSVTNLA